MHGIIDYRPHLEYKRRLRAILTDVTEPAYSISDEKVKLSPSEELQQQYRGKPYQPSQAVLDAVDITPTDVLMAYANAENKIGTVIDSIVKNLKDDVTVSPSISDYIKAREEKQTDMIYAFEDYHHDNIEGSTAAEVLPVLYHFLEEIESLKPFIGDYLYPEELSQDFDYLVDQIERLREVEQGQVKTMVQEDQAYTLDTEALQEKNHILGFLHERADTTHEFAQEIERLISVKPEEVYYDSGKRIATLAAEQSILRHQFQKTNQNSFEKHKANTADAYQRMKRLVTRDYKKRLLEETVKLQEEKLGSRDAIHLLQIVNPEEEGDPMNIFLSEVVDTIQTNKETCDALVDDLYKITEMEHFQNVDYLGSLTGKNQCRHVHKILTGVEALHMEDRNTETEISRLFT